MAEGRGWVRALVPLVPLGALLALLAWWGPADAVRGDYPPVEELTFQRVVLEPNAIRATGLNDGPDPVTIAQVQVDEAFWGFTVEGDQTLGHLGLFAATGLLLVFGFMLRQVVNTRKPHTQTVRQRL